MKGKIHNVSWMWSRLTSPRGDTWSFSFPFSNSYPSRSQPSCVQGASRRPEGKGLAPGALSLALARPSEGAASIHPDLTSSCVAE